MDRVWPRACVLYCPAYHQFLRWKDEEVPIMDGWTESVTDLITSNARRGRLEFLRQPDDRTILIFLNDHKALAIFTAVQCPQIMRGLVTIQRRWRIKARRLHAA